MDLFDTPVDRTGTYSDKWEKYKSEDIIPMWVADTDFASPKPIVDALHERVAHQVFGYTAVPDELNQAFIERMARQYDWHVKPEWLVYLPGMVCALNLACRAYSNPGDGVLIPSPIYPPFQSAPRLADQKAIKIPMILRGQRWVMDMDLLENSITPQTRTLLFCNPHNPAGTVYNRAELERLAEIAEQHELVIVSDEIHCELLLDDVEHIPFASISDAAAKRSVVLMAPSKTFNIAGLGCSIAVIPDTRLRERYKRTRMGVVPSVNLMGYTAAQAAYTECDEWLEQQLEYLRRNRDYIEQQLGQYAQVKVTHLEATYLSWIDVSALELDDPHAYFEEAGVGLSPGKDFGDNNFVRLNFGCSMATLQLGISRMKSAIEKRLAEIS